jgi:hypothetical protein
VANRERHTTEPSEPDRTTLRCFVIGPIGNRHAAAGSKDRETYEEALQVLELVIEPACKAVGLEPIRADGLGRPGEITDQVFRRLRNDDVVIADLTGANANVMYELGLRHTCDLLTVQVGEFGRLPFDINVIRTVQFSRSPYGLVTARDELIGLLEAGLAGEYDPVSATRVWNEARVDPGNVADGPSDEGEAIEALAAPDDAPGFLDLLAAGEDGQERVNEAADAISAAMQAMGDLAVASTQRMAQSDAQGRGMKGRLALTIEFAASLSKVAEEFEQAASVYVDAMEAVSSANLAIIERLEQDPSQVQEASDWAMMTRRLAATARDTLSSVSEFADTMNENAKLARVLREPTSKIVRGLEQFAVATGVVDEWDRRLQALGVPVPPEDWEPDETPPTEPDQTESSESSDE